MHTILKQLKNKIIVSCQPNEGGPQDDTKIIISMAFIVTDAKAACSGETCCTVSSGVTTAPDFSEGSCDTEPASYGITIYEKYLCTSNEIKLEDPFPYWLVAQ